MVNIVREPVLGHSSKIAARMGICNKPGPCLHGEGRLQAAVLFLELGDAYWYIDIAAVGAESMC